MGKVLPTLTDLSRMQTFEDCPRQRYLEFHAAGRGIVPSRISPDLTIGIAVHRGVEAIMRKFQGLILTADLANFPDWMDYGVQSALSEYDSIAKTKEFSGMEPSESMLFAYEEARCMVEALVRLWARTSVPYGFRVLDVEREVEYTLVDGGDDPIVVMTRADAILENPATGGLLVYSLKTKSTWTEADQKRNKFDDQGINELLGVREAYPGRDIEGVRMLFLLKGSYKKDKDGNRRWQTPLVHPYVNYGVVGQAYRPDYIAAKGWQKADIGRGVDMSVKDWIDHLATWFPDVLTKQVANPVEYFREDWDIKEWIETKAWRETQVREALKTDASYKTFFGKNRSWCYQYRQECPYVPICWQGTTVDQGLQSGQYVQRTPHHKRELDLVGGEK